MCSGHYDARFRVLVCTLAALLGLQLKDVTAAETSFLESLERQQEEETR